MKSHLLIAFTASLFLLACGDDGDDTTPDSSTPTMCVGAYASLTPAQFVDGAADTGMCVNATDLDLACSVNLSGLTGMCGQGCALGMPNATQQELGACTAACVKTDVPTVSDACLGCYIQSFGCTIANCRDECIGGATLPGCITCREENQCTSSFYTCSGLPVPQAP